MHILLNAILNDYSKSKISRVYDNYDLPQEIYKLYISKWKKFVYEELIIELMYILFIL